MKIADRASPRALLSVSLNSEFTFIDLVLLRMVQGFMLVYPFYFMFHHQSANLFFAKGKCKS